MRNKQKLYCGDFITKSDNIESGVVDLIVSDLPYGTIKTLGNLKKYKRLNNSLWNKTIEPQKIYNVSDRILRKNGKLILFSQEPYTSKLINNAKHSLPLSQKAIWEKDHFANCLISKKTMVSYYEDILIFYKSYDLNKNNPLRVYFRKVLKFIGLSKHIIVKSIGQRADHVFRVDSPQFSLCTSDTYATLIRLFNIQEMEEFKQFSELKYMNDVYNKKHQNTFNLWNGKNYKGNVLHYKKDYSGYHPTQKPVLLLEDLIKTFSNPGDLVVDLTAGSGSTGVACKNTNRNFILIEKDEGYVDIIKKRIK